MGRHPQHRTRGLHAYGILAQSIVVGGGVAIDGSPDPNVTARLGAYATGNMFSSELIVGVTLNDTGSSTIGTQGDGPDAGTVQATYHSALTTAGNGAFGIVAQSIGGGGGLVGASQGVAITAQLGSGSTAESDGATVTVHLTSERSVTTTGVGSHGVVAQSIGGGGGGVVSSYQYGEVPKLVEGISAAGYGNGGDVTVTSNRAISVNGAGAYGVLAQSIGGGLIAVKNGNVHLGNGGSSQDGQGQGGTATVNVQGSVSATGENGIGIVAQSDGPDSSDTVTVNVGGVNPGDNPGTVTGGFGAQGVGILIAGGNSKNQINISDSSWVYALSETAIKAVGAHVVNVDNKGQIYGTTLLNGGSISGNFQNPNGKPPTESAGTLTNSGALVALPGKRSYVDGHLVQTATGHIAPHLDYSNLQSGTYEVTGNAVLDGHIRPNLARAMPGIFLPALAVNGAVTGALEAPDSPLFSYTLRENAGQYDIAITDTHFDESRFGLTEQHNAVAGALETVFASGDAELGAFFAGLDSSAGSDTRSIAGGGAREPDGGVCARCRGCIAYRRRVHELSENSAARPGRGRS